MGTTSALQGINNCWQQEGHPIKKIHALTNKHFDPIKTLEYECKTVKKNKNTDQTVSIFSANQT